LSVTHSDHFLQELAARQLLPVALHIAGEFGLGVADLHRDPDVWLSSPAVTEARAAFARHLRGKCGWSVRLIANLLGYTRHGVYYMLGEGGRRRAVAAERRTAKVGVRI